MTIGWCTSSCMPSSSLLSASSPPQDVPITMISYTSRGLSVDALRSIHDLVGIGIRRECDRFLPSQRERPERREALVEEALHAVLQRLVEVDHHVPAEDHVELVERTIRDEVVLCEDDVLGERPAEPRAVVCGDVVLGELPLASRLDVVLGVLLHL